LTTDEFIKKQNAKLAVILEKNIPLQLAVRSVMAMQSKRIFLEGKNSKGSLIGNYGNYPLYVSEKYRKSTNLPSFPLKGKTGETKFKNGNTHKSGYFGNYLAFKIAVKLNKRVNTVDLFLTGTLHRHWANGDVVGKAEARKVSVNEYYVGISNDDAKKIDRYNNVFNLSLQEKETFFKVIRGELKKALL
jgi:hypothetical protein